MGVRGSFPEGKAGSREADHSPPASAEIKKTCIYTPTSPYTFMAQCLVKHTDTFAFTSYKDLFMQYSSTPYYFVPLWSKYCPPHSACKYTQSMFFSLDVSDHLSHLSIDKIIVLYILIVYVLDTRQKGKWFWTEWQQALPEFSPLSISSQIQFLSVTGMMSDKSSF
jgi:hypothetical protein